MKIRIIIFLSCFVHQFAQDKTLKIINGKDAAPHEFPFIASLQKDEQHFCGASLINKNTLITAAHCVKGEDPNDIKVVLGAHNLHNDHQNSMQILEVERFILHPYFSSFTYANDIALIHLKHPAQLNEFVQPIALAKFNLISEGSVTLAGWGSIHLTDDFLTDFPDILQTTQLNIIDFQNCLKSCNPFLDEGQFCAADSSSKPGGGDSGGPIIQNGELIGIVSHGWSKNCPLTGYYTRVSYYSHFLTQQYPFFSFL